MSEEINAPPAAPAQHETSIEVKPATPPEESAKGPMIGPRGTNSSYADSRAE